MAKESKLMGLAKGNTKSVSQKKSTPVKKVVEKPKTPDEVRNDLAKQKVEQLLADVPTLITKVEEPQEVVKEPVQGIEWLEEQVETLTTENEQLKLELDDAKANYSRLYEDFQKKLGSGNQMLDATIETNIITMFNELQGNMLGLNRERTPWAIVNISYLLKQMLAMFPFTEQYKKF